MFFLAAVPFLEVVGVIPIAIFAGLSTFPVLILALLGNLATLILLILLVDWVKRWRRGPEGPDGRQGASSKRAMRAKKIWNKYGLPGLAVTGPILIGSHLAAFMSISLGGTKKWTTLWMTSSVAVWGVVTAVLAHLGVDFFYGRIGQEPVLMRLLEQ